MATQSGPTPPSESMVSTPPDGALLIVRTDEKMGKTKKRINLLRPRYAVRTAHGARFEAALIPTRIKQDIVGRFIHIFYFVLASYPKDCSCPSFVYFQPAFEICMKTIGGDSDGERIATLVRLLSQVVNLGASSGSTTAPEFPNLHPKVISTRLCWNLHVTD